MKDIKFMKRGSAGEGRQTPDPAAADGGRIAGGASPTKAA
jgi:hypothetical protein